MDDGMIPPNILAAPRDGGGLFFVFVFTPSHKIHKTAQYHGKPHRQGILERQNRLHTISQNHTKPFSKNVINLTLFLRKTTFQNIVKYPLRSGKCELIHL